MHNAKKKRQHKEKNLVVNKKCCFQITLFPLWDPPTASTATLVEAETVTGFDCRCDSRLLRALSEQVQNLVFASLSGHFELCNKRLWWLC